MEDPTFRDFQAWVCAGHFSHWGLPFWKEFRAAVKLALSPYCEERLASDESEAVFQIAAEKGMLFLKEYLDKPITPFLDRPPYQLLADLLEARNKNRRVVESERKEEKKREERERGDHIQLLENAKYVKAGNMSTVKVDDNPPAGTFSEYTETMFKVLEPLGDVENPVRDTLLQSLNRLIAMEMAKHRGEEVDWDTPPEELKTNVLTLWTRLKAERIVANIDLEEWKETRERLNGTLLQAAGEDLQVWELRKKMLARDILRAVDNVKAIVNNHEASFACLLRFYRRQVDLEYSPYIAELRADRDSLPADLQE